MKILLSNDDGFKSKGLLILENSLSKYGSVMMVVPKKNVSACSSSLSVHSDVKLKEIDSNHYIDKINNGKNIPIIVGGTGLYIWALLDNWSLPDVPPNEKFRANLENKIVNFGHEYIKNTFIFLGYPLVIKVFFYVKKFVQQLLL